MNNLDSFFDKTEVVKLIDFDEVEENTKQKSSLFFDYLTDICFHKKGDIPQKSDFEMKQFDKYMIMRYLSLDSGYLPLINILNQYQEVLTPQQLYKILIIILPRGKKFLQYPKLKEKIHKDEEVNMLKTYYDCSRRDIMEYLEMGLLSNKERDDIIEKFGKNDIKKGKKKKS